MSNKSSWRTLLVVSLAAFGLAVFRLSAETPSHAPVPMKRLDPSPSLNR